jgi:hypothetical protein
MEQAAEPFVLLAEGGIGPVGDEQHRRQDHQQPGDLAVGGQHGHGDEGQAGVGHRGHGSAGQRLPGRRVVETALLERDGREDQRPAEQVGDQHGGEGGSQADRARRRPPGQQPGEDQRRDAGHEPEQCQVEHQLQAPLARLDDQHGQRPGQAGQDHAHRVDEMEAEDQRHLHQGDRVDLTPELQVDPEHHTGPEQHGEHRPGQVEAVVRLGQAAHRPEQQRGRGGDRGQAEHERGRDAPHTTTSPCSGPL